MKKAFKLLTIMPLIFSTYGHAEITLNGFASIVGGQTTSDNETLYGFDNDFDFKNGSLLALQASSDLGEGFSVTAQIMAKGVDDWDPEFAWAYVAYDINDNWRVLAGRQRAPFYMYSDYLDVSYAYPWITPPRGVYDLLFDSYDGVAVLHTGTLGSWDMSNHIIYGSNDDPLTLFGDDIDPDFQTLVGGAITLTKDWFTFRLARMQADISLPLTDIEGLAAGWQAVGQNDIANNVLIEKDSGTFTDIGIQIDYNSFILNAEYTMLELDDTPLADQDSYYIMVGKRFDEFLLAVTYGKDDSDTVYLTEGVPYGIHPSIDFLKASTDGLTTVSQDDDSTYVTIGMRWDFHPSAAFKMEYTTSSNDVNSAEDADLIRVALVTVF